MAKKKPTLYELGPDNNVYVHPHEGQGKALTTKKRFIFALAGTQSGKTAIAPVWLYNEMVEKGPGDYMAVSPSYPLQQRKLLPEYQLFFERTKKIGKYYKAERTMKIKDVDGSEYNIYFASADNPDSLESATIKAVHIDEAGQDSFRLEAWEALLRRLSIHEGRALVTTTIYNLGWMKNEIYDKWVAGDPDIEIIQFPSTANPNFPAAEFEKRKAALPDWKFKMFYMGEYARPAGMIYSDFNTDVHKIKPVSIPASMTRYVGIDPGAIHTALVWVAADERAGRFYVYRSSLQGNKTTAEHVRLAKQYADSNYVLRWIGGSASEKQFRHDWEQAGIRVEEPKFSDVEIGIDRVTRLFKENRLFIFDTDDNKGLFDELGTYSRVLDEKAQPTEKIKDKEKFHRLDALRYVVQLFNLSESAGALPTPEQATGRQNMAQQMFIQRNDRRPTL